MDLWWRALTGEPDLLTWDLWGQKALAHQCFTADGQVVVSDAVRVFRRFFGEKWLASSVEMGMPIQQTCFLDSQVLSVAVNLLDLYAKIALAADDKSARPLQRVMKRRLDGLAWRHCLVQLEVAGLARRAGWDVAFEPAVGQRNRADLCLTVPGGQKVLMDTLVLGLAETVVKADHWHASVQGRMEWGLRQRFGNTLEVGGDVGRSGSDEQLEEWIRQVYQAAERCIESGEPAVIPGPTGGRILIGPAGRGERQSLVGAPVISDERDRIIDRIHNKRHQLAAASCLWLRIDHLGGLWSLTPWSQHDLQAKAASLFHVLERTLGGEDGVSGLVISNGALDIAGTDVPEGVIRAPQAYGLRCRLPTGTVRETFILRGDGTNEALARTLASWYAEEASWLDWALQELGHRNLTALVRQPEF